MDIKVCQISVRDLIEWLSTGWAYWAGSVGFGWKWPLDPKTKACWATPEQSELEDRSQKKKIMFLHSKNKASQKGYKGEC